MRDLDEISPLEVEGFERNELFFFSRCQEKASMTSQHSTARGGI